MTTAQKISREKRELALQQIKAREIVGEIIRFGVSQHQILYIIRLLALELEDMKLMQDLNDVMIQASAVDEDSLSCDDSSKKTKIYT